MTVFAKCHDNIIDSFLRSGHMRGCYGAHATKMEINIQSNHMIQTTKVNAP